MLELVFRRGRRHGLGELALAAHAEAATNFLTYG